MTRVVDLSQAFVGIKFVHTAIVSLPITAPAGGLATAFDLAAFRLSMIAPVKKSVNHSRTVASMRETGWEQQQEVRLRSDSMAFDSVK